MSRAAALKISIETALAGRIPSALTPPTQAVRPLFPTGITALDAMLGGLPIGSISELVGPDCSGRTSLALSYLAGITAAGQVCAWIDVSDTLCPQSAAAAGVSLNRLLWVRCGEVAPAQGATQTRPVPVRLTEAALAAPVMATRSTQGGGSPHPRAEVRGLDAAVQDLMRRKDSFVRDKSIGTPAVRNRPLIAAHSAATSAAQVPRRRVEQVATDRLPSRRGEAVLRGGERIAALCAEPQSRAPRAAKPDLSAAALPNVPKAFAAGAKKPWTRLDQALRATDLLLQAGGFAAIVLDLGSVSREHALQVPLATWFRYRAAVEKAQTTLVLLTQEICAKSSAGLVLRMHPAEELDGAPRVFHGLSFQTELLRQRFVAGDVSNVVPMRKPPRRENSAAWSGRTAWTAGRGA